MIAHELNYGDTIFDTYNNRWGTVSVLPDGVMSIMLESDMADCVIGYDYGHGSYCETQARDAYPLVKDRYFWGNPVCSEINMDEMDAYHDFEFYCPNRDENCWDFEC